MSKKILSTLCFVSVFTVGTFAALPAIDALAGAYSVGDPLSASWTVMLGSFVARGTDFRGNAVSANSTAKWTADAFGNDQYSQLKLTETAGGAGTCVRLTGTGGTGTGMCYYNDTFGNKGLWTMAGSQATTKVVSATTTAANGDTIRLEVSGTIYTMKLDAGSTGSFSTNGSTYDDTGTYPSGAAGITANDTGGHFNNFQADNLGGGGGGGATNCTRSLLGVGCFFKAPLEK